MQKMSMTNDEWMKILELPAQAFYQQYFKLQNEGKLKFIKWRPLAPHIKTQLRQTALNLNIYKNYLMNPDK